MVEYLSLFMFLTVCLLLMLGYPVAFTLAGTALAFAASATDLPPSGHVIRSLDVPAGRRSGGACREQGEPK